MNMSEFWDEFLAKTENFKLMERAVRASLRRISANQQEIIEDAISYVSEEILKDNKKPLQPYDPAKDINGDGKAFFYFTVCRIVRDYRTKKFGRIRYPIEIMRHPDFLMVLVFNLLCHQRLSADVVVDQLKDAGKDSNAVRNAIKDIRITYPNCGKPKFKELAVEDIDASPRYNEENNAKALSPPLQNTYNKLLLMQIGYLLGIVLDTKIKDIPDNPYLPNKIKKLETVLKQKFKATDDERRFLRLVYLERMKVGAAGKKVGWNKSVAKEKHRQLKRRLHRIMPKSVWHEFNSCFEN